MADFSQSYNTPIPPERQEGYRQWLAAQSKASGRDISRDAADYDIQGFFLSGAGKDSRGHGTDQFKKPNHPTFSTESQYNGTGNQAGGQWLNQNGKDYFLAMPSNVQYQSPSDLQGYFSKYEPSTSLVMPPSGTEKLGLPGPPKPPIPQGLRTGRKYYGER